VSSKCIKKILQNFTEKILQQLYKSIQMQYQQLCWKRNKVILEKIKLPLPTSFVVAGARPAELKSSIYFRKEK
jgi:hypothetical protein